MTNYFLAYLNNHIFINYKKKDDNTETTGLRAFCNKHGISYESARKVTSGSNSYPGVTLRIKEAIKADIIEFDNIYPDKYFLKRVRGL